MEKMAFLEWQKGNFSEAKKLFEEVVRKREVIHGECYFDCIRNLMVISLFIKNIGSKSEADKLYEKLKRVLDKMDISNDKFTLGCFQIAISFVNLLKVSEADELLHQLLGKEKKFYVNNLPISLHVKFEIGQVLMITKKYQEAIACFEDILKTYRDLSEIEYVLYFLCRQDISLTYCLMGNFSEAEIQLEHLLKENTAKFGKYDSDGFAILSLIAKCYLKQSKLRKAKSILEKVLNHQVKVYGKKSWINLQTSLTKCDTLIFMRNFGEAESLIEELLKNAALVFGKDNPFYLSVLSSKCNLKREMGMYKEAVDILEEVLLKQLEVVGKYHEDYLESKRILACLYRDSHKFSESLYIFKDILRLQSSFLETNHEDSLKTKMQIASTYIQMKKCEKSSTLLKEILKIQREKLQEDHQDTVHAMGLFAVSMFGLGERKTGASVFEDFLRKIKLSFRNVDLLACISQTLKYVNEFVNSKRLLEKVLTISIDVYGYHHPFTLDCRINLGKSLMLLEKPSEAKVMFQQILKDLPKVYPRDHSIFLDVKTAIALAMKDMQNYEEAILILTEVLMTRKEAEIIDPKFFQGSILIADLFSKLGKFTEMSLTIKEALKILSKIDCNDPCFSEISDTLNDLDNLCNMLLSMNI